MALAPISSLQVICNHSSSYHDLANMNDCSKFKRTNERARAKHNRQQFRNLIDVMNNYVHNEKLNTNRCLSIITSTLHLQKFFEKNPDDWNGTAVEELVDVEHLDAKDLSLPQATSLLKDVQQNISSGFFPTEFILNTWNLAGIGFDSSGRILYTSTNFLKMLGLNEPITGQNVKDFVSQKSQILDKVFRLKIRSWVDYISIQRTTGKETVCIVWKGKVFADKAGESAFHHP